MGMAWATLIVGGLVGLLTGWQGGRLHQSARHSVDGYKGAVGAVPVAYKGAVGAVKELAGFVGGLAALGALVFLVVWLA